MTLSDQVSIGLSAYRRAFEIIFTRGLWWYFAIPFLLNLLLFIAGFTYAGAIVKPVQEWFIEVTGLNNADFFLSEFLHGFVLIFIIILIKILFFLAFAMFGGYITLIILSPFLALLSEKTEKIISGRDYPFNAAQFVRDIVRSILLSLRNLLYQTLFTIILFLAGFVPVAGWLSPFVLYIISAYFYGFSFMDYSMERKRYSISYSSQFINRNKWVAITNGAIFSLVLLVPFVGPLLAGFSAIVSTVAATITVEKLISTT